MSVNARLLVSMIFLASSVHAAPIDVTLQSKTGVYTTPYSYSVTEQITGGNITVKNKTGGSTVATYSFGARPVSTPVTGSGSSFNLYNYYSMTLTGPDGTGDGVLDDKDGNGLLDISKFKLDNNNSGVGFSPSSGISFGSSGLISPTSGNTNFKLILVGTGGSFSSSGYINVASQPASVSGNTDASTGSTAPDGQNPNFPGRSDVLNLTELAGGTFTGTLSFHNDISLGSIQIGLSTPSGSGYQVGPSTRASSINSQNLITDVNVSAPFSLLNEDITSNSNTPYFDDLRTTFTIGDFGISGPIVIHTTATAVYNVQAIETLIGGVGYVANGTINVSYDATYSVWPRSLVVTSAVLSDGVAVTVPEVPTFFLGGLGVVGFLFFARRQSLLAK